MSEELAGTRVCVVGAGAMGGLVGGGLLRGGCHVSFVDRGARVAQLREQGLTLVAPDGQTRTFAGVEVLDAEEAAAEFDVVFLAVKAYDLPRVAPRLPALVGAGTTLVTLQNGIPWWYFHRMGGALDGRRLHAVDPTGALAEHVDADRVIGCVPYPAAELLPGGAVKHVEGDRLPVGELDGSDTPRVRHVAALLEAGGFRARVLDDLRSETWLKAWGNLAFNPLSALTGATLSEICRFEPTRGLAAAMMAEAQAVAEALGARFRVGIEQRIRGAEQVGHHKTSMLQDLEAGRQLETEALVGAVLELAAAVGVAAPSIRAVYAAVRLLEQTRRAPAGTTAVPVKRSIPASLVPGVSDARAGTA